MDMMNFIGYKHADRYGNKCDRVPVNEDDEIVPQTESGPRTKFCLCCRKYTDIWFNGVLPGHAYACKFTIFNRRAMVIVVGDTRGHMRVISYREAENELTVT